MFRVALLALLGVAGAVFIAMWWKSFAARRAEAQAPSLWHLAIGAVTNFFDTLGIGSFATTTAMYKMLRLVPDQRIPGTLVVGHGLPVVAQAFLFIAAVAVDPILLASMIVSCVLGGWLGVGIVTRLPKRGIQFGMGAALLLAALFMTMTQLELFPGGGTALSLPAGKLIFANVVSFFLGALVTLGIGNYAPTLVLLSLLGMDPRAAFPVMMGSGALVAVVSGMRFLDTDRYEPRAALGLTLGGIPAVLFAGLVVKSLPLDVLRWVVVVVVVYAAVVMLRGATTGERAPEPGT